MQMYLHDTGLGRRYIFGGVYVNHTKTNRKNGAESRRIVERQEGLHKVRSLRSRRKSYLPVKFLYIEKILRAVSGDPPDL